MRHARVQFETTKNHLRKQITLKTGSGMSQQICVRTTDARRTDAHTSDFWGSLHNKPWRAIISMIGRDFWMWISYGKTREAQWSTGSSMMVEDFDFARKGRCFSCYEGVQINSGHSETKYRRRNSCVRNCDVWFWDTFSQRILAAWSCMAV